MQPKSADYLPWRLARLAADDDPSEVEFELFETAQEPAAILAAYRGKVGLNLLDTKLILAAEDFLEVLCALRDRLAQWDFPLPPEHEHELRAAVLAFVSARDRVERLNMHNARSKGGKMVASKRLAGKAALHTKIRKEAAKFRASDMAREAAVILARTFQLSPSQIRKIVKRKPS